MPCGRIELPPRFRRCCFQDSLQSQPAYTAYYAAHRTRTCKPLAGRRFSGAENYHYSNAAWAPTPGLEPGHRGIPDYCHLSKMIPYQLGLCRHIKCSWWDLNPYFTDFKSAASAVGLQEHIQDRGTVLALRARHKPLKSAFWVQRVCCINKVDTIPPILHNKNTACVQTVLVIIKGDKYHSCVFIPAFPHEPAIRICTQQNNSLSRRDGKARW